MYQHEQNKFETSVHTFGGLNADFDIQTVEFHSRPFSHSCEFGEDESHASIVLVKVTPESTKDVVVARQIIDLSKFDLSITNRLVVVMEVD